MGHNHTYLTMQNDFIVSTFSPQSDMQNYTRTSILQRGRVVLQRLDYKPNYRTREFYFLKQGIFMNPMFNKYIVKCRKERHFIDFGKRKRDEVLLEEQLNNARADAERTGNRQQLQKLKNQQPHLSN